MDVQMHHYDDYSPTCATTEDLLVTWVIDEELTVGSLSTMHMEEGGILWARK